MQMLENVSARLGLTTIKGLKAKGLKAKGLKDKGSKAKGFFLQN